YTPTIGGGRQMNVEPSTGATVTRPGAGSPPAFLRQQEVQTGRPTMREAAPITSAPASAPLQSSGQVYQPSQRQAPVAAPSNVPIQGSGQMYAPAQRQMAPARAPYPDQVPMQQRPFVREAPPQAPPHAQQYVPAPPQAPQYAP